MDSQPERVNFLNYLRALKSQGPQESEKIEAWRLAVLQDRDMRHAAVHDAEGVAKTALASVTLRLWPDPDEIPQSVMQALVVAGVTVGWSRPDL
jgi:hypothetical protein